MSRPADELAALLSAALAGELAGDVILAGPWLAERGGRLQRNGRGTWDDKAAQFDEYADRRAQELADDFEAAVRRADEQVREVLKAKPDGWTLADYEGLAAAVENALTREGFEALRRRAVDLVDDFAARYFDLTGQRLTASALEAARAGMELKTVWMSKLPQDAVEAIGEALAAGGTTPVSLEEMGRELERVSGAAKGKQYAESVELLIRQGKQKILNAYAEQLGLDVALYFGPPASDSVIRPFCAHCVGYGWPKEALAGADNGYQPNVLETRGGWGCRHVLIWSKAVDFDLVAPGKRVLRWEYREQEIQPANPETGRLARIIRYPKWLELAPAA